MPSACWRALLAVCCLLPHAILVAQETPPPLVEADRFEPSEEEAATPQPAAPDDVAEIRRDISAIKQDIQLLQETLDLIVNRMMADLEKENAQLREALREAQALAPGGEATPGGGFVPQPEALHFDDAGAMPPAVEATPPALPEAFSWDVVAEWGRDPETAARLGSDVSSLKGMVIVVPPGSLREDVERLARELRSEYTAYDNINIEIYDDLAAAESHARRQVSDPAHRVASISRHKASGRDTILYLRGEKAEPVNPAP